MMKSHWTFIIACSALKVMGSAGFVLFVIPSEVEESLL